MVVIVECGDHVRQKDEAPGGPQPAIDSPEIGSRGKLNGRQLPTDCQSIEQHGESDRPADYEVASEHNLSSGWVAGLGGAL